MLNGATLETRYKSALKIPAKNPTTGTGSTIF